MAFVHGSPLTNMDNHGHRTMDDHVLLNGNMDNTHSMDKSGTVTRVTTYNMVSDYDLYRQHDH